MDFESRPKFWRLYERRNAEVAKGVTYGEEVRSEDKLMWKSVMA